MDAFENKLWWFVYNEVGVHPDDYDLDFSGSLALEISLEKEGLGEWEVPVDAKPDSHFDTWASEVSANSVLEDKLLGYFIAKGSKELKQKWEGCDPSDAPEVQDILLGEVKSRGYELVVN